MLARRLPGVLPALAPDEALEVTRIHSVVGLLLPGHPLIGSPPFRAPHHSASVAAIVGGGPGPRPGEASLAHHGVLLLDELPEFVRPALEALRQPLEDGVVSIARAQGMALFPARFQLVATMNLCPCGGRGDPAVECSCSTQRLAAFRDKLSRALLDRFDLVVTVPRPRAHELAAAPAEPSSAVAERVSAAREALCSPPAPYGGGGRAAHARRRAVAAVRARARPRRARGPVDRGACRSRNPCCRSTSRRRSRTGCRESSTRERARRRSLRGRDRLSSRRRAALGALRAVRARVRRAALPRGARGSRASAGLPAREPAFPRGLASIFDPPVGIFVRGHGGRRRCSSGLPSRS